MQEPIEPMEDLQPIEDISINDGELSFENVDFKYDIKTILSNVSFLIPQGEVSAFVGPSGSGKSTIFNLIERMYDIELEILNMERKVFMMFQLQIGETRLVM